jgi:hypothetical protein
MPTKRRKLTGAAVEIRVTDPEHLNADGALAIPARARHIVVDALDAVNPAFA